MGESAQPPISLTVLRYGDRLSIDVAAVDALIPRSETQIDDAFLQDLAEELRLLVIPSSVSLHGSESQKLSLVSGPRTEVSRIQHLGGLIFSHLLTEPARLRLRASAPCNLYLRLDEQLLSIPWELAFDGSTFLATKFRMGRQVITSYPLPRQTTTRAVAESFKVLLIADPTESLPQAGREVEQLCTLLEDVAGIEVTLMGGKNVRRLPLLAAVQEHDIVHFAGHSFYDSTAPGQGGWQLHEGVLSAAEISKVSRPPLLVFSNSCQAGATSTWEGEKGYRYEGQAFGIGSAFLIAGVQNYIGTFWVVHDEESVDFALTFYRNLATGLPLGGALQAARQATIERHDWQELTWASYMLYGDPAFMLLPPGQESSRVNAFPAEKPAQEQASLVSELLAPPQPAHARKRAGLPCRKSVRKLIFIAALVTGALVIISFFLWSSRQQPPHSSQQIHHPKAVGVMPFRSLHSDPQLEWMREAIRDNFNSQLSSATDLKVYSKEYIDFLVQKGLTTEIEVANQLGVAKMISGSFLAISDTLRIEAHVVDVQSGVLEASDHVEGTLDDFFSLHKQLVVKIMTRLNIAVPSEEKSHSPAPPTATPNLDAYKLLLEAEGETAVTASRKEEDSHSKRLPRKKADKHSQVSPEWPGISRAWAQESPQQPGSEEGIQQVLETYRQAYEKKDLSLLENVYDTLAPTQREANVKYFQNTQDLHVTISDVDIVVRGNEAAVSYTREDQFVDAKTGRNVKLDARFTKIFVRKDGVWKIIVGK